ncbi:MAG: DNRLRE domain-containing protein [Verrucomicrobia bacterium]|nr:DNRLRE domain-containing protein [Verrucomicrobiota bacterium]MCH8512724.1 DNRLRE domain-containing protein [Kiritimatiellia bacterium]
MKTKTSKFFALATLLTALLTGASAFAQTFQFQEGVSPDGTFTHQNTYIREGQNTTNLNGDDLLVGYNGSGSALRLRAIFEFDLSSVIDSGLTIEELSLTLTVASGSSDAITINMYELSPGGDLNTPFNQAEATWDQYSSGNDWDTPGGDFGSTLLSSVNTSGSTSTGDTFTFSNTPEFISAAQAAYENSRPFQFILVSNDETARDLMRIVSNAGSESDRPLLTVTAIPEPGTLVLLGIALGTLVIFRRRKA